MSLTTITSPPLWSPAYNPILWEVRSDQTNQFKFRYVFDVYIGGATTPLRYKVPPNPKGVGIINVQSLCEAELTIAENLPFLSPTVFSNGQGLATRVYILAGEEYAGSPTGDPVIYNGSGFVGPPAFGLYANGDFRPAQDYTTPVVAWSAGQGAQDYYAYQSLGGEGILDYEIAVGQVPDTGGKFLTRCPLPVQTIRSDEDFTLTWLNYNFEAATGPQSTPYAMKVTTFLGGATVGATGIFNIEANGGTWTSCTTYGTGATAAEDLLMSFKINMADVGTIVPGLFDEVHLQLFPYSSYGTCSLGATGISETIKLTVDDTNCWGFEPIRLTWMNNLGGRDWYTFIKRNTFTQNAERETFFQLPKYWSGNGFSVGDINPARYGTTVFNVSLEQTWTASTDWLTEEESSWLRDLFKSPSVHAYLPGYDQPTLVVVTDASYSVQTYAREKLFQYFISFTEAQPDTVQSY